VTGSTGRNFPDLRVLDGSLTSGVGFVVTTRDGGASTGVFERGNLADHVGDSPAAVADNRASLARHLGAERGLAVIAAEHGASSKWVREPGTYGQADALVTDVRGLGIVALGADCAVIGIGATRGDGSFVAGVAHCGWRGLVLDVVSSLVRQIEDAGGQDLQAVLGPTICGACYQVDESRAQQVMGACTPRVARAAVGASVLVGRYQLDVRAGARERLVELGVNVRYEYPCTAEDGRWFSYRSATDHRGPSAQTGRHGLGVVIGAVGAVGTEESR